VSSPSLTESYNAYGFHFDEGELSKLNIKRENGNSIRCFKNSVNESQNLNINVN
jgi:hypothetical protein